MAYVERYNLHWDSQSGQEGHIRIYEESYGGAAETLRLARGSLQVRKSVDSFEDHIVRQNCSFTIINNEADWFDLLPLMTSEEDLYKVEVELETGAPSPDILFSGFMETKVAQQGMLMFAPLNITASGFINKLENVRVTEVDTLQNMSLIDIIDACLRATGVSQNIKVRSTLYEQSNTLSSGQTLFNRTGVWSEVFWENNYDRMSALQILETILKTFRCYLYWFDEYWWIEQYDDMRWGYNADFVEYTTGVSYEYADTGSAISEDRNAYNVNAFDQEGGSQVMSVMPGQKEVEIRHNQKPFNNLLLNDFSDATAVSTAPTVSRPTYRDWEYWQAGGMSWTYTGAWKTMANSMYRTGYSGTVDEHLGLMSSLLISVAAETSLTLQFKFGIAFLADLPGPLGFKGYEAAFDFKFHWWLSWGPLMFITYNDSTELWEVGLSDWITSTQEIIVNGADLDPDLLIHEVEITIPIGEIAALIGDDIALTFGIGTEVIDPNDGDPGTTPVPADHAYYGDVFGAVSEDPQNNIINGDINSGFLNKLDIDLDLYDADSWNYKNGLLSSTNILTGNDFSARTAAWGTGSDWQTISKKLIQYIFRFYNISRQKLKLVYRTTAVFMPFHVFTDTLQSSKPFVLSSDVFYPDLDKHEVELLEFDNTTVINLI